MLTCGSWRTGLWAEMRATCALGRCGAAKPGDVGPWAETMWMCGSRRCGPVGRKGELQARKDAPYARRTAGTSRTPVPRCAVSPEAQAREVPRGGRAAAGGPGGRHARALAAAARPGARTCALRRARGGVRLHHRGRVRGWRGHVRAFGRLACGGGCARARTRGRPVRGRRPRGAARAHRHGLPPAQRQALRRRAGGPPARAAGRPPRVRGGRGGAGLPLRLLAARRAARRVPAAARPAGLNRAPREAAASASSVGCQADGTRDKSTPCPNLWRPCPNAGTADRLSPRGCRPAAGPRPWRPGCRSRPPRRPATGGGTPRPRCSA